MDSKNSKNSNNGNSKFTELFQTITNGLARTGKISNIEYGALKKGPNEISNGGIFDKVYMFLTIIGVLTVVALIIICILNFIKILVIKIKEKTTVKNNKIILRDTLEYKLLNYSNEMKETEKPSKKTSFWNKLFSSKTTKSTIKNDPLFIDVQITITVVLYQIIAIFLIVFVINMLLSFLPFIKMIKSGMMNVGIIQEMKKSINSIDNLYYYWFGGLCFVAVLSTLLLEFVFKASVNKVIFDIRKKAYQLKKRMGENLYVDKTFINMLYSDNFDAVKDLIRQKINGNVQTASKMIFTYNVYQHYISNFRLSDKYMQDFKEAFTYENLKGVSNDTFEPIEFLIYDDDIGSLTFEDHFMKDITSNIESTNDSDLIDLMNIYIQTKIGGITIQDDSLNKLKQMNDITINFTQSNLEKVYKAIFVFVLIMFVVAVILFRLLISVGMMFDTSQKLINDIGTSIQNFFQMIWNGLTSFFSRFYTK